MTHKEAVERLAVLYGEICMLGERGDRASKLELPKLVAYLHDLRSKKRFALMEYKRANAHILWSTSKNPCQEIPL